MINEVRSRSTVTSGPIRQGIDQHWVLLTWGRGGGEAGSKIMRNVIIVVIVLFSAGRARRKATKIKYFLKDKS